MKNKFKNKLVPILFFIGFLYLLYYLVIKNIIVLGNHNKEKKNNAIKIKTLEYKLKEMEEIKELKLKDIKLIESKSMDMKKGNNFKNISEYENEIDYFLNKNRMNLKYIGRLERKTSGNNLEKISIPIGISSTEENMLSFLRDIETSKYEISFLKSYLKIEYKDGEILFEGKINALVDENYSEIKNEEEKSRGLIRNRERLFLDNRNIRYIRIGDNFYFMK